MRFILALLLSSLSYSLSAKNEHDTGGEKPKASVMYNDPEEIRSDLMGKLVDCARTMQGMLGRTLSSHVLTAGPVEWN